MPGTGAPQATADLTAVMARAQERIRQKPFVWQGPEMELMLRTEGLCSRGQIGWSTGGYQASTHMEKSTKTHLVDLCARSSGNKLFIVWMLHFPVYTVVSSGHFFLHSLYYFNHSYIKTFCLSEYSVLWRCQLFSGSRRTAVLGL